MMNLAKNQTPGVGNIMPIGHFWSKLSSGYEIARTQLFNQNCAPWFGNRVFFS